MSLNEATERTLRIDTRAAGGVYTCLAYAAGEVDSYGSTMTPDAFAGVTVDDFRILEYHKHDRDPVGKPVALRITPAGLEVDFVPADTERGREIQQLIDGGFIRAVSVGFVPLEGYARQDGVMVYTKCELHELSLVNTPSSKGAKIKLARAMGLAATDAQLRAVFGDDSDVADGEPVDTYDDVDQPTAEPLTEEAQVEEVTSVDADAIDSSADEAAATVNDAQERQLLLLARLSRSKR